MKYYQKFVRFATPALLLALCTENHAATALPITVTGYNTDVVFEVGGTPGSAGKFLNEGEALYESGLGGASGSGLPTTASGRTFTSYYTVGDTTIFSLAAYNANNALIVQESGGPTVKFATWTFAEAYKQQYSKLSVLGLSSGGSSNFSFVVFFTDNTNTGSGTNIEGRFDTRGAFDGQQLPDWFNSGGTAAGQAKTGVGRVQSGNGTSFSGDNAGGGVRLQQFNFDLTPYAGKIVDHVEFESTGGGGNNRAFLAISGVAVPEPSSSMMALAGLTLLAFRRSRRNFGV